MGEKREQILAHFARNAKRRTSRSMAPVIKIEFLNNKYNNKYT
jgi:hypothetical protein